MKRGYARFLIIIAAIVIAALISAYVLHEVSSVVDNGARHLTQDQRARMTAALALSPTEQYTFQLKCIPDCEECMHFADELRDFINTVPGWKVGGGSLPFAGQGWRTGLSLVTKNDEQRRSPPVEKVRKAFESAGIKLNFQSEDLRSDAFEIVVGSAGRSR